MNPRARHGRRAFAPSLACAAVLAGFAMPFALGAQSAPESFSERLQQAARAAGNPLRFMTGPESGASSGDPRGDSAANLRRPNAPPAGRAAPPSGPANGRQAAPGNATNNGAAKPARPAQPQEKLEKFSLPASVILGDGRAVRGRVHFNAPAKVVVTHTRDGIQYRKTIRVRDLRSIEVTQWKGEPLRKNRKGEWVYRFAPRLSTLTLENGLVLKENARLLPYFERFTVRNSNGEVTLFAFWMDLLRADGSWFTGITGPTNGLRRSGHKDVVQRIEFGQPEDHD